MDLFCIFQAESCDLDPNEQQKAATHATCDATDGHPPLPNKNTFQHACAQLRILMNLLKETCQTSLLCDGKYAGRPKLVRASFTCLNNRDY